MISVIIYTLGMRIGIIIIIRAIKLTQGKGLVIGYQIIRFIRAVRVMCNTIIVTALIPCLWRQKVEWFECTFVFRLIRDVKLFLLRVEVIPIFSWMIIRFIRLLEFMITRLLSFRAFRINRFNR